MKSLSKKDQDLQDEFSKMSLPEFIKFIKEKYPTPEERLSFINQIPEKDSLGKILIENIKKKLYFTEILLG